MAQFVITGNRLVDGAVVWRRPVGGWSLNITAADIQAADGQLARSLAAARAEEAGGQIIGVYEVEVETRNSEVLPIRLRERIRVDGPTVLPI